MGFRSQQFASRGFFRPDPAEEAERISRRKAARAVAREEDAETFGSCEDYPCCGHESGGCPSSKGRYSCASCGKVMPKGYGSAVCRSCHSRSARRQDREEYGY